MKVHLTFFPLQRPSRLLLKLWDSAARRKDSSLYLVCLWNTSPAPPHPQTNHICFLSLCACLCVWGEGRQGSLAAWDGRRWPGWRSRVHKAQPRGIFSLACCSVTQSCPALCDPMDCSTWRFPVLHYLPEFAQTHVHWVGEAIQPSHPLPPSSPFAFSLFQHHASVRDSFFFFSHR